MFTLLMIIIIKPNSVIYICIITVVCLASSAFLCSEYSCGLFVTNHSFSLNIMKVFNVLSRYEVISFQSLKLVSFNWNQMLIFLAVVTKPFDNNDNVQFLVLALGCNFILKQYFYVVHFSLYMTFFSGNDCHDICYYFDPVWGLYHDF